MTKSNENTPRPVPLQGMPLHKWIARQSERPVRPIGPSADDGSGDYPFIVIRLMSSLYQAEKIRVRQGRASVRLGVGKSILQLPDPFKSDGQISDEAKDLLINAVLAAVKRTGLRMCLVWGPAWCSFVELDGAINNSFEPPSGGSSMTAAVDFNGGFSVSKAGVRRLGYRSKGPWV